MDVDNERPTAEDDVMDYDESMDAEHEHGDDEMMEDDEEYEEEETMEAEPVSALTVDGSARPIEAESVPTASEMGISPEAAGLSPVVPPLPVSQLEAIVDADVIEAASSPKPAETGKQIGEDAPLATSESQSLPQLEGTTDAPPIPIAQNTPVAPALQANVAPVMGRESENTTDSEAALPQMQPVSEAEEASADSADPTTGADDGADEENEEEYGLDVHSLPPIIVNLPKLGARSLFEPLPEGDGLKLPVWLLSKQEDFGEASLSDLLEAIKQLLQKENLTSPGQLVLTEKQMGLTMCEDDKNLQTITLLDLLQLHQDCELPVPVQLFVSFDNSRFIARFEAIMHELDVRAEKESSEQAETQETQDATDEIAGAGEVEEEDATHGHEVEEDVEDGEEDLQEDVVEAAPEEHTTERSRRAERPSREDVRARYADSVGDRASRMRSPLAPDSAPRTTSTSMTEFFRRKPEPLSTPTVDDVSVSVPPPLRPGVLSEDETPAATGTPAPPSVIEEVDEESLKDGIDTKASSHPDRDTASTLLSTDFSTVNTVILDANDSLQSGALAPNAQDTLQPTEKPEPVPVDKADKQVSESVQITGPGDVEDEEHEEDEFGIDSFVEQVGDGEDYDDDEVETSDTVPAQAEAAGQPANAKPSPPVEEGRVGANDHEAKASASAITESSGDQPKTSPEGSDSQDEEYYEEDDDEEYEDEEEAVGVDSPHPSEGDERSPTLGREESSTLETALSVDDTLESGQPEGKQPMTSEAILSSSEEPISGLPSSISLSSESVLSPVKRSFPSDDLDDTITLESKKAKTEVASDTDSTAKQI